MTAENEAPTRRVRMTPEDRRKQFIGIGLRKFVERPLLEVSLEDVAEEAGVSTGLLYHYFDTKVDFHRAVIEAAARRVMRNVSPEDGITGEEAVRQVTGRLIDQIVRRRESYLALVYGQADWTPDFDEDAANRLRDTLARIVADRAHLDDAVRPIIHSWIAYVEDRALQWSAVAEPEDHDELVEHCTRALFALVALES